MTSTSATFEPPDKKFGRSLGQVLLLAAGLFVLIAISTLSVVLVNQSRKDNAWVVHTVEVENQVNTILLNIRRTESATRAYMLSQAPQFLAEKEDAASIILPEIDHLADLTKDNPIQAENSARLRKAAEGRLADFDRGIDRTKNNDVAASIEILRKGQSTKAAEEITQIAEAMHAEEYRLFLERTKTADRTQLLASIVTVVGSGLVIALAAMSVFLVRRSLRARDIAEAKLRDANLNLEATVDERTADLREANQEIQRFAYIVSHDLRSPLVNIMGFTSELDELRGDIFKRIATLAGPSVPVPASATDAGELEPVLDEKDRRLAQDFSEALGFIKSSIAKMDRLITAILTLTREG
ncbi:MAG TPA: CHASE3 domain-containing protein, partial [Bradyrhizobium sp.]|nr:CHASE3 domain-containing protein [Bradyrhizobium sp.]